MATAYKTTLAAGNTPPNTGHGINTLSVHLHSQSASTTFALNDTVTFGYLPPNAVVVGAILKAQSQLDSNGSPTLALSLGVTGTATLFKSSITTVGRAAGATADATIAGAGYLYKNTTGAKIAVLATISTAAATAVAGILECDIEYYVEDAVGSAP